MRKMEHKRARFLFVPVAAMACVGAFLNAQSWKEIPPTELKGKPITEPALAPTPFALDGQRPWTGESVDFRSETQMLPQDRDLARDAESSIRERAGFEGFELDDGKWTYQQILCRALPNHLFLKSTRNKGTGDISVFVASVPRGEDGRVRTIPIVRRGYSLFSPAPINAHTISVFNHIRTEERTVGSVNWLDTGLCYVALAGTDPRTSIFAKSESRLTIAAAPTPFLEVSKGGGAVIHLTSTTETKTLEWTLIFDGKGKLLKVGHRHEVSPKERMISQNVEGTNGKL